jgi:hypothetical protein
MNISRSNDNMNVHVNYSEENGKNKKKDTDIKYISQKKLVDKMVQRNYNEYKKNQEKVNKVYQEWVHPELNLFNTVHLNKCVCKNCGNIKDIKNENKKDKSYF